MPSLTYAETGFKPSSRKRTRVAVDDQPSDHRAYSSWNRRDEALTILLDAEHVAPEQIRRHVISRQLVIRWIANSAANRATTLPSQRSGCTSSERVPVGFSLVADDPRDRSRAYVAAGVSFFDDADRIPLVQPTYRDYWDIPGGYIETGETPAQAAAREVREELGIESDYARLRSLVGIEGRRTDNRGEDNPVPSAQCGAWSPTGRAVHVLEAGVHSSHLRYAEAQAIRRSADITWQVDGFPPS